MYKSKFELPIIVSNACHGPMPRHDAFKTTLHHCVSWCKVSYGNLSMQMILGFLQCGIVAGCEYSVDRNYTIDQPATHIPRVSHNDLSRTGEIVCTTTTTATTTAAKAAYEPKLVQRRISHLQLSWVA